jgi:four helix bundle protein
MTPSDEVKSYRDLLVWKAGIQLAVICYRITSEFPRYELFGLTGQMRRAAVSIPSNLAERHNRSHRKEFLQFVSVAKGSLGELETQMTLAVPIGYLDAKEAEPFFARCEELGKMLTGLKHALSLYSR